MMAHKLPQLNVSVTLQKKIHRLAGVFLRQTSGIRDTGYGKRLVFGSILLAILLTVSSLLPSASLAVSQSINIQGKVTNANGTNVADGVYDFVFKLYDGAGSGATNTFTESWTSAALFSSTMSSAPSSGGTSLTYSSNTNEATLRAGQILWNTTKKEAVKIVAVDTGTNVLTISATAQSWNTSDTVTNQVYVKDGIFQVGLNSLNANWGTTDFNQDEIHLGVNFNSDGEMKPRSQFNSVIYAFRSQSAETVDGLTIASGKTATINNSLTLNGTDGAVLDLDNNLSVAGTGGLSLTTGAATTVDFTGSGNGVGGLLYSSSANTWSYLARGSDGQCLQSNATTLTWGTCGGTIAADSLDFDDLSDTMTLDATTDIALGGFNLTTSGSGALSFANTGGVAISGNLSIGADKTIKLTGGTSFPGSPTEGEMFYRTDADQLYLYTGSKWQADRSTATKIVAASDSQNKEKADYVADGTNDESEIESAISALPSTGGMIVLLDGTYSIGTDITLTKSNVTLMGMGKSTILSRAFNEPTASTTGLITVGDGGTTAVSGITITNLAINGNDATHTSTSNYGVFFHHKVSQSNVTNTWLYENGGAAIMTTSDASSLSTNDYNVFDGNQIWNGSSFGIDIDWHAYGVRITNNLIRNNGDDGIIVQPISSSNITVANNTVLSNSGSGIYIYDSDRVTVADNSVRSNTGIGIDLYSTENSTVGGNTVVASGDMGIKLNSSTNISVGNNTVQGGSKTGIYLTSATYSSITNNTIKDNTEHGISSVLNTANNIISSNVIHNNGSTGSSNGINLSLNADNHTIIGNRITDTAGTGYAINIDNSFGDSNNNYLADNSYSGTGASTISDVGIGTIYGNQINSSGDLLLKPTGNLGIGLTAPTAQVHLKGNLATSLSGTFGVTNASASVSTSVDQTATLNAGDAITFGSQSGTAYTILSLNSTTITLTANYTGTTNGSTTGSRDVTTLFEIDNGAGTAKFSINKTGTLTLGSFSVTNGGAVTATTVNGMTISSSTGTFTLTNGKTLAVQNSLTFSGTDASSVNFGTGGTVCYTAGSCAVSADSLDFDDFVDAMTLDASTSIAAAYNQGLSITGSMSGGNRSTSAFSVTQSNDGTNDLAGAVVTFTNNDTASMSQAVLKIDQQASDGVGISITGNRNAAGFVYNTGSAGWANSFAAYHSSSATATYAGVSFYSSLSRSYGSAGTYNEGGLLLDLSRSGGSTLAGVTLNVTNPAASISSNCAQTAGTCNDATNVLRLTQSYANSTGAVLGITGAGTGNLATLDASNSSANGLLVDVQSSSTSQYALNVTTNNGATNGLYVRADGNVGVGTISAINNKLSVSKSGNAAWGISIENADTGNNAFAELSFYNSAGYRGALGVGSPNVTSSTYAGRTYVWNNTSSGGLSLIAGAGSSDIRFFTAGDASGNERMRIDSNGQVGIGTAPSAAKLHVYTSTSGEGLAFFRDDGRTADLKISSTAANIVQLLVGGSDELQFSTNNTADNGIRIDVDGNVGIGDTNPDAKLDVTSTATGDAAQIVANSLTTGKGLYISSTSTSLSTGGLLGLYWNPGSATTATGDLFSLDVGANGTVGNILNIKNNGSSVFSISQSQITANLPVAFQSAGDVAMAYDLVFTNPTASYIKSQAPLIIQSGESFNSSDLVLSTYNNGIIQLDTITAQVGASGAGSTTPGFLGLGVKSTTGDPTGGFEGAMYYNTFDNKFRCYENSAWTDCISAGGSIVADSLDFDDFADAMTLDASTSIAAAHNLGLSVTSSLTGGARSTAAFSITQANDATNNFTNNLVEFINSDTASAGTVLSISNAGSGTALGVTGSAAISGALTAGTVNGLTITSSTGTLTITNGKTISVSNTLTFTGTDSSSVNFGAGGTVCYTSGSCAVSADSLDFDDFIDAMTVDASTTIDAGANFGLTINSTLSGGARSTSVVTISQANDATNNSTSTILDLINSDTVSTTGAVLKITQVTAGTSVLINGSNTGTGINMTAASSGTGISFGGTGLTSGTYIAGTGNLSSSLNAFTGSYIKFSPSRTHTGASSINDTGNFLVLTRNNTINTTTGGVVYTISGDLASLSSNCTVAGGANVGTCTDTASILKLDQQYTSASGTVLNVLGAGTGNLASLDAANSSANGLLVDVQSSSSSQYAIRASINNGTTAFQVLGDNTVDIGGASLGEMLDVRGAIELLAISAPACAAGEYKVYADSGTSKLRKCENGTVSDIGGAGGSSLFTDGGTFTYLTASTDDFVLGDTTVAGASMYFDESAGNLYLGTNESLNGVLTFYSSGVGETDPTIAADASGNLVLSAPSGTVQIGDGTGNIELKLETAADVFLADKTVTLSGAYSANDFTFTRSLTAGANTAGGAVVKISDITGGSTTLNADLLYVNSTPASGAFTGNLLRLESGTTNRFVVSGAGVVTIGASGNTITFDPSSGTSGMLFAGTARPVKTLVIAPEFANMTFTTDGSSTTDGNMTSDNTNSSATSFRNYYEWSSTNASLQDYTIAVRVTLPSDFDDWDTTGFELAYQTGTASTADNAVSFKLYEVSDGTNIVCDRSTDRASTSWTTTNMTCAGSTLNDGASSEWDAAGETALIKIKVKAKNTASALARVGEMTLRYKARF